MGVSIHGPTDVTFQLWRVRRWGFGGLLGSIFFDWSVLMPIDVVWLGCLLGREETALARISEDSRLFTSVTSQNYTSILTDVILVGSTSVFSFVHYYEKLFSLLCFSL